MIVDEEQIWTSLGVRQIVLKTPEGRSPAAVAARDKELAGHRRRGTWDEDSVVEMRESHDSCRLRMLPRSTM